jgi:membrane protein
MKLLGSTKGEYDFRRWKAALVRAFGKLQWGDVRSLFLESVSGWNKHNAPHLGAALAFWALLSFVPLLLVIIAIAGLAFGHRAAEQGVIEQIRMLIGAQRAQIFETLLNGAQNKAEGVAATFVGMLTLAFGATGVLIELRNAMNTIWDVAPRQMSTAQEIRTYVKERLWSIALVIGMSLFLTVSVLLGTWISAAGEFYASILPASELLMHFLNVALSFAALTVLFCAIYKVVPEVPLEWRDVLLGALTTALLFTPGNFLLGLYLGKVSFSSTYGAAASAIVLAVWVYYSSQVFFLGAEFTRAFARRYGSSRMRGPARIVPHGTTPRVTRPA